MNPKPRLAAAALALMAISAPAAAAPAKHHHAAKAVAPTAAPSAPPKLLIAIAVDQYSADLFAQYRQHYTAGLARLMTGAVFPSAFQSHAATETCPGHSTILTGVHPSRSGIIGNAWFDLDTARPEKRVYCAEDEHDPNSTSSVPVVSTVTCTKIGVSVPAAARAIFPPFTAALICSGSWQVSIRMASTPPAIRPRHCSAMAASSGS